MFGMTAFLGLKAGTMAAEEFIEKAPSRFLINIPNKKLSIERIV
jgi:hypothetical protein